jgi:hypothetical protein
MISGWETRDELLAAVEASGRSISTFALGRLHRSGLIPAPQVHALGRGRGTESRYPMGSAARLVRVVDMQAREHRLSHAAWRLWWEGDGLLAPPGRQLLAQTAQKLELQRDLIASMLEGDDSGAPDAVAAMDHLYADAQDSRIDGALGEARQNVGRDRFAAVVRALAEIGTGRFVPSNEGDPDPVEPLVERALGLDGARRDRMAGRDPWLSSPPGSGLGVLADVITAASMTELAKASDQELGLARDEIQSFITAVASTGKLLEHLHGRGAFGLGLISRMLDTAHPRSQANLLLGWLSLRRNPDLLAGLERIGVLAPQAAATAQLFGLIGELRAEIPTLAAVLSNERLAAAQVDVGAARKLNSDITEFRKIHAKQFDDFFSKHPETDGLIAILDAGQPDELSDTGDSYSARVAAANASA